MKMLTELKHCLPETSLAVKDLPSNVGDMGLIPTRGTKIPHAVRQLSPRATTGGAQAPQLRSFTLQLRPDTAKQKQTIKNKP